MNEDYNTPTAIHTAIDTLKDPHGPLEVLADGELISTFLEKNESTLHAFGEDRSRPIRRFDLPPARWLQTPEDYIDKFSGTAQPGEFYVFQIGLFVAHRSIEELGITFSDLAGNDSLIPASALNCFNAGGKDYRGNAFDKTVSIAKGRVQALWIGIAVPANAKGVYEGIVGIVADGKRVAAVSVTLTVSGELLTDHGESDPNRLARLRWLDSCIGLDDNSVTSAYEPITVRDRTIRILGRELVLNDTGLPEQIRSFFSAGNTSVTESAQDILSSPMRLIAEANAGPIPLTPGPIEILRQQDGAVEWRVENRSGKLTIEVTGLMEFDGSVEYRICLKANEDVSVKDIRLETVYTPAASAYFMGLGQRGGKIPQALDWRWDDSVHQDGWWLGAVNGGTKIRLKGSNYRMPLINCYYEYGKLNVPDSWGNDGQGGIALRVDDCAAITAFSGPRTMRADDELQFNFDILITPFKVIDTDRQWASRYYHGYHGAEDEHYKDLSLIKKTGATVANLHHSKTANPILNYPYSSMSIDLLKECAQRAHDQGLLFKVYYTTREITQLMKELWPFFSLDGEIVFPGPGKESRTLTNPEGPHPWLTENLRENFIPAWHEELAGRYKGLLDLTVITTPDSRLDNFFLEGLNYLVDYVGIDGLYIDDTALGRKGFQRARRILEQKRPDVRLDMHSWDHLNESAGMASSAYVYMEGFPYYDRLWFGEGFSNSLYKDGGPDSWLVEVSGIPFGLMSDMMYAGDTWRGLIFGMTARLGWAGNPHPQPIWKLWDDFGMAGCSMYGFWHSGNPVHTSNPSVPVTVYLKQGSALIVMANWSDADAGVTLDIDWGAIGLTPSTVTLSAPDIEGVQESAILDVNSCLTVPGNRGLILILAEAVNN